MLPSMSSLSPSEASHQPAVYGHVGSPGAGGAMGFADPETGIAYGYVTSQMGTTLTGDPRDVAPRDVLYAAVAQQE